MTAKHADLTAKHNSSVEEQKTINDNIMKDYNSKLDNLDSTHKTNNSSLRDRMIQISGSEEEITGYIGDLKARFDAIALKEDGVTDWTIGELNKGVVQSMMKLNTYITAQRASIAGVQSDVVARDNRRGSEISKLNTDLTAQRASIAGVQSDVVARDNRRGSEISKLNTTVTGLDSKYDSKYAPIDKNTWDSVQFGGPDKVHLGVGSTKQTLANYVESVVNKMNSESSGSGTVM